MLNRKNAISVEKAITRGKFLLAYLPMLIIFFVFLASFFFIDFLNLPKWYLVPAFLVAIALGWLQWSLCVIKWKIWAYKNVRNVHKLYRKAVEYKLIWEDDSFYNKTQIVSRQDKIELHYLEKKFEEVDEYQDDISIPDKIMIYHSKYLLAFFLIFGISSLFLGIFFFDDPKKYLFYFTSILMFYQFYIRIKIGCYLEINSEGITYKETELFEWKNMISEKVVYDANTKKHKLVICRMEVSNDEVVNMEEDLENEEIYEISVSDFFKTKEIEIDDLSVKPIEIERIIQVFRVRYNKKVEN